MIIWLASYPRSGNTFVRLLLNYMYDVCMYPPRPGIRNAGIVAPLSESLAEMADAPEPYIVKTHNLPDGDNYPAIYILRDGRDSLVSYGRYILSFATDANTPKNEVTFRHTLYGLIVHNNSFGGWGSNVSLWTQRARTVIVKFEDLVQDPFGVVERGLDAIGCPPLNKGKLNRGDMPTFAEMHRKEPELFRRGQVGAWQTEMPTDLEELFWQRHGTVMQQVGYQR